MRLFKLGNIGGFMPEQWKSIRGIWEQVRRRGNKGCCLMLIGRSAIYSFQNKYGSREGSKKSRRQVFAKPGQ